MYITQEIADKIKATVKIRGFSMKTLLKECGLNINAISEFSKGKQLSCLSLARIADYLDCSVDYLLGRTDAPGTGAQNSELTPDEKTILAEFRALNEEGQAMANGLMDSLSKNNEYKKRSSFPEEMKKDA